MGSVFFVRHRLARLLVCILAVLTSLLPFLPVLAAPPPYYVSPELDDAIVLPLPDEQASELQEDTSPPDTISLTLQTPPYQVLADGDGFDIIQIEGFNLTGTPGAPALPRKVYQVAVPPTAAADSVTLEILDTQIAQLPGTYHLKPATPDLASCGTTDDGVTSQITGMPLSYDASDFVRLLPPGQLRKWHFVRLEFSPVRYDVASGELGLATQVTVRISYDHSQAVSGMAAMQDTVMDDVAKETFVNYDTAQEWYRAVGGQDEPGVVYDYVIITTNAIEAGSTNLAGFASHKEDLGYSVLIITEDEYGSLEGQSPNGTAEKIRKWLQNNYIGYAIEYVLLIGNPDPSVGDVPMKMCWPRRGATDDYPEAPTDHFYADLTGNWDLDGDGYFGEWGGDYGPSGGVDFAQEVTVGRIPVYAGDYATLDDILQKIIDYENETNPSSWRNTALLPMSYGTSTYDGAPLAEQMMDDYLALGGYSNWTQYQQASGACSLNSIFSSNEELRGGTVVRDRWAANDYGLVVWWGHGYWTSAAVGCDGCWDGTLFQSSYAPSLDDDHPSFVYLNSCLNGYPEYAGNLQYALLQHGGIGTVGATRVSWFNTGIGYGEFDGSTTNSGIGYEFARRLVQDQTAGDAIYNTKASMAPEQATRLMNFYDFNLYGDPSVGLASAGTPGDLTASPVSPTQIRLGWVDNSTDESGFKIERSPDGAAGWTQVYTTVTNVTAYTDTNLMGNTTYYYKVRAYHGDEDSEYTNIASATTPMAVSGVHLTRIPAGGLFVGNTVRFTAYADGTTPFTHTWTLNDTPVAAYGNMFEGTLDAVGDFTVGVTVANAYSQDSYTESLTVSQPLPDQPDLSRSYKMVNPTDVQPGGILTYSLNLRNTSAATATVVLTDPIPGHTSYVTDSAWASNGSPVTLAEGHLHWSGQVISGTPVIVTFGVAVTSHLSAATPITNIAYADDGSGHVALLETRSTYDPGYRLTINDGALYTNIPTVTLRYGWNPVDNITTAKFSNDGGFGDAQSIAVNPADPTVPSWVLSAYGDVRLPQTVYARFYDAAGRHYGLVLDTIMYDPNPPPPLHVEVITQTTPDIGAAETQQIILRVTTNDDNSGVKHVQISGSPDFTQYTEFAVTGSTTDIPWTLPTCGLIHIRAQDRAGNLSAAAIENQSARCVVYFPTVLKQ